MLPGVGAMRLLLLAIRSGVILKTICYQRSCGLKFSEYRTSTCRVFAVATRLISVACVSYLEGRICSLGRTKTPSLAASYIAYSR